LVVGNAEAIGAIDKDATLRIGNDVAVHYRAAPALRGRHSKRIETMKVLSPNMAWLLKMLHVAC